MQKISLLALLMTQVRAAGRRVRIPMIAEREMSFATLTTLGFTVERETIGYVAANQEKGHS